MITKKINSATENYEDIVTTEMVLDDTPTKGSFNSVTSDGVAKAIEQGGGGGGSYSAGNGVSISEGTISANVDGTTIGFDASGKLKSLVEGKTYTAGAGITINNDTISAAVDGVTIKAEAPSSVSADKDSFFGTMRFPIASLGDVQLNSVISEISYGEGSTPFKIGSTGDQTGLDIRLQIGNDQSYTKSAVSTKSFINTSDFSDAVLDFQTTIFNSYISLRGGMGQTLTFASLFGLNATTFAELFSGEYLYMRLVAWDSNGGQVWGSPLTNPTSTGAETYYSANIKLSGNFFPSVLKVTNILPDYTSSDEGKVLGVVSDGASGYTTDWVSAGGGSGAYIADFRGIGSMTDAQKSALAGAIYSAASVGTPVFAKLDSIQGGDSHTPNARLLPMTDFYFSDIGDFKFHFTAPFDWYDPENSYAPHRGFNVVEFYNADWAQTPYPFSDTFYEASFTAMNPAPHR